MLVFRARARDKLKRPSTSPATRVNCMTHSCWERDESVTTMAWGSALSNDDREEMDLLQ